MRVSQSLVFGLLALLLCFSASAKEREPKDETVILPPATRYSGNTPIELNNGMLFNNGTYGAPNQEYEAWAKSPMVVAGLSERPYSFVQKPQFVIILSEQVQWGEAAIANWKNTTNEYPDAVPYAKAAVEKMTPALDKLKSALSSAKSAGDNGWASSESEARRALIDFRVSYMQMHKNVQARQLK